ncbi:PIG-L family deacetylase [Candidatus Gottesmanbacteria bacterium]|nr:PIG-L family deacetylase [Candidatus Gottesmanbacteria bacterium]
MKKLLLVFAHPDDESFSCGGTVAKYVKAGWDVHLLCATRGERGETGPYDALAPEALGSIRQKEVQLAASVLGIHTVSFLDYIDGTLAARTPGDIEDFVYRKMLELIPDCVITFDTTGVSNHPDHIKLCYSTTYAFQKYAAWVAQQLEDRPAVDENTLPKLYYICMPESIATYLKKMKNIPQELFNKPWKGTPDEKITTVIDTAKFMNKKKKALAAHISQRADVNRFLSLSRHPLLIKEYFILRYHGTKEIFMGKNDRVSNKL